MAWAGCLATSQRPNSRLGQIPHNACGINDVVRQKFPREIARSKGRIGITTPRFAPACWSGIGQTQEGASGKVSSSSLGTFMTEAGHFSPETVRSMQVALDLAWSSFSPEQQSQSSRMEVATRILNAAEAGERSPARFLMLALLSASGP
jgi:hypothetical protein